MLVATWRSNPILWPTLLLLGLLCPCSGRAQTGQLPIRTYTTADGLARDQINCIRRDSRGFLWFCTEEGLSRFDGYKFTNYTTEQGLPNRRVNSLLETRNGAYWVATGHGLCRFNPTGMAAPAGSTKDAGKAAAPMFDCQTGEHGMGQVQALTEDSDGTVWCGTNDGLYRVAEAGGQWALHYVDLGMPHPNDDAHMVDALVSDRRNTLWVGTRGSGIYRRWPDGRTEHYTTEQGLAANRINALLEDPAGELWAGTAKGLCELVPGVEPNRTLVARVFTMKDGLPGDWVYGLFESSEKRLLTVTIGGLSEYKPTAKPHEQQFRSYTEVNGLKGPELVALAEDSDGNLWLGTNNNGVIKMARNGFTTYGPADGLSNTMVASVFANQAGDVCTISLGKDTSLGKATLTLSCFNGKRFVSTTPRFPQDIRDFGWGWNQLGLQDHTGEWWLPTAQGLVRFPRVSRFEQLAYTRPKVVYTTKDGLPRNEIFRLFEDSHGDIWISTVSPAHNGLSRWERATESLHTYTETGGPCPPCELPLAFAEDRDGNLWISTNASRLVRYRLGHFTSFTVADGVPSVWIDGLYLDHVGRLWIASNAGGLARVDDPAAEHPHFVTYTTAQGLASNEVSCITEDQEGRIYAGTGRGVDQLDLTTGQIRHYTAADGLFRGGVQTAFRDRNGVLWFASDNGLANFVPQAIEPATPPPIFISGLRISGIAQLVSELGARDIGSLSLSSAQNQVQIDFVGLEFGAGENLYYQYKLEGAERDWSRLTDQRTVNYASLSPGAYRFLVRAVNTTGLSSPAPATVSFTILPPIWRRWWVLTIAALLIGMTVYVAHRYRVGRLLELERVRTRIAIDLHDDIGSNLSLIAGLSDALSHEAAHVDAQITDRLSLIANVSQRSVDAMSDIVWAVNPHKDHLLDLAQRMRRFASDAFSARNIQFHFVAPGVAQDITIKTEMRRELLLIFKESVNNAVKHSGCSQAEASLQISNGMIALRIVDNGKGFDAAISEHGNGLASMRQRAAKIGGALQLISQPGSGTVVALTAPIK